jgi:hypothetical protein
MRVERRFLFTAGAVPGAERRIPFAGFRMTGWNSNPQWAVPSRTDRRLYVARVRKGS